MSNSIPALAVPGGVVPAVATPVVPTDALPSADWSVEKLQDYALGQFSTGEEDAEKLANLARKTVESYWRAGCALTVLKTKIGAKEFSAWRKGFNIPAQRSDDCMAFFARTRDDFERVRELKLPEAKRQVGLLTAEGKRAPLTGLTRPVHRKKTRGTSGGTDMPHITRYTIEHLRDDVQRVADSVKGGRVSAMDAAAENAVVQAAAALRVAAEAIDVGIVAAIAKANKAAVGQTLTAAANGDTVVPAPSKTPGRKGSGVSA